MGLILNRNIVAVSSGIQKATESSSPAYRPPPGSLIDAIAQFRPARISPPRIAVLPTRFVCILKSINTPAAYHIGLTSDVERRLQSTTLAYPLIPANISWRRLVMIDFDDEQPAVEVERYLKTGSAREFAPRHFRPSMSG